MTVNEIGASTYVKNEVGMLIGNENETKSHDSFFNVFMLGWKVLPGK